MLSQSSVLVRTVLGRSTSSLGFGTKHSSWCTRKFSRNSSLNSNNPTDPNAASTTSRVAAESTENAPSVVAASKNVLKGGFAKAMAKMEGHENFPKTIKYSPLVQMGDPQGKIVEGIITHVVDDDLYIDFGAKFNCVCPRPQKNGSAYILGKKVRIMIHDLELSTRFLGAKTDLTILEADCSLLGLARFDK